MRRLKPVVSIAVVVAFLTPYIAVASGLLASWLFVHFHWLGMFHLDQSSVARMIAGCVVFIVVSGLTYAAAHFHWLPIVIAKLERADAKVPGAPLPPAGATPTSATGGAPGSPARG